MSECFQAMMRRVWLDNALITGIQEINLPLQQIIESSAESEELLKTLSGLPEQRKALMREWEAKDQKLSTLIETLNTILAQIRREEEILWGSK